MINGGIIHWFLNDSVQPFTCERRSIWETKVLVIKKRKNQKQTKRNNFALHVFPNNRGAFNRPLTADCPTIPSVHHVDL